MSLLRPTSTGERVGRLMIAVGLVLLSWFTLTAGQGGGERIDGILDEGTPGAHHAWFFTQPGSELPVTWSSCRPVRYVVNPQYAPEAWRDLVERAVAEVEDASGLDFVFKGLTDDRAFNRSISSPTDFPPVLIGWARPDEVADLHGNVVGAAGPDSITVDGHTTFVTGKVILDAEYFTELEQRADADGAVAVMMHEIGHLLGLDHVDDPGELMYAENLGRTTFGPGDRQGLGILGAGWCVDLG